LLFFAVDGAGFSDIPCRTSRFNHQSEKKMKQLLRLTVALATGLFALALASITTPASAATNEYCRQDVTSGMRSCGFATMEQCQAMSSGRGGTCFRDPYMTDTSAYAYQPKGGLHRARRPVQ
jgi:hypothetical protein